MKCISIRQPWAWLIIHGGKDIENRTWPSNHRGPLLIHASKGMTRSEYEDAKAFAMSRVGFRKEFPKMEDLVRGAIIGKVEMVNCASDCLSEWRSPGQYGFVLRNPEPIEPIPYRGTLGIFNISLELPI